MHEAERAELDRVQRESSEHMSNARDSIAQSTEHIRQSKEAIRQSLDLLKDTPVSNGVKSSKMPSGD